MNARRAADIWHHRRGLHEAKGKSALALNEEPFLKKETAPARGKGWGCLGATSVPVASVRRVSARQTSPLAPLAWPASRQIG
jgi:hypothetical protein